MLLMKRVRAGALVLIVLSTTSGVVRAQPAPPASGKREWSSVCMRNFQKIQDRETVIMQGFPGQNGDIASARHARTGLFTACMASDPEARTKYNDSLAEERSWQDEICRPNPRLCQDFYPNATRALMAEFQIAMNDPNYSVEYGPIGGNANRAAPQAASPARSASSSPGPSFPSTPVDPGPRAANGRYYSEQPSPAVIAEGQKTLDELDRLALAARDYVNGGDEEGEDAKDCLQPVNDDTNGLRLVNACPYAIEAVWCTEGVDCRPTFSNQKYMHRPEDYISPPSRAADDAYIRSGACRGHLTIHQNGMPALRYYCTKEKP